MATVTQITTIRLLVGEPGAETYTDVLLGERIDTAQNDLDLVARDIWVEKAAALAEVPDISEAGSSRSMGRLYDNALKMVEYFNKKLDTATAAAAGGTKIRRLTR